MSPVVCHHSHETYFLCLIKEGQYMALCARLSLLDCLSWLLQKTYICFDTSPPAACVSQMRNKRRCVWSQNYLWAKRRPTSRKTIRNSQQDTTILHLPAPFTENLQKKLPLTGPRTENTRNAHMQSGYDMMIKSYHQLCFNDKN